jgi:hypothetical protein
MAGFKHLRRLEKEVISIGKKYGYSMTKVSDYSSWKAATIMARIPLSTPFYIDERRLFVREIIIKDPGFRMIVVGRDTSNKKWKIEAECLGNAIVDKLYTFILKQREAMA